MSKEISAVASRLASLGVDDLVFVGGAVIDLILTDPAAPEARPTLDVDAVTPAASRNAYHELEEKLRAAGHTQPPDGPICRWIIEGIVVDLMPSFEGILGFSNRWYPDLISNAMTVTLPGGDAIRVAAAPYLIASKIEAFYGRGDEDYRFSHDMTDIIVVIDGRAEVAAEAATAPSDVREYLATAFGTFLADPSFLDALPGHLPADAASQARVPIILERMARISSLGRDGAS